MSLRHLIGLVLAGVFLMPTEAISQDRKSSSPQVLDSILTYSTARVDNARFDTQSGLVRAQYRLSPTQKTFRDTDSAVLDFARANREDYGWQGDLSDLRKISERSSRESHHVLLQQTFEDIPVYGRYVRINLSKQFQPTLVVSGYDPTAAITASFNRAASFDRLAVVKSLGVTFDANVVVHSAELNWLQDGSSFVKIWRAIVSVPGEIGEWETLVSAQDGVILFTFNHSFVRKANVDSEQSTPIQPTQNPLITRQGNASSAEAGLVRVDGTGMVFDPDPLSTSGSFYTPPFVDNGDADIPEVNAQRTSVSLPEITLRSGSYFLEGPYVNIVGGGSLNYIPPSEADASNFQYVRSSQHFEAVNAYYHIDKSQRYIQSLGFTNIAATPVSINPRAFGSDNSVFSPSQNLIQYGIGGVDDAEDAGVVWHEYGHAILESSTGGLISTSEGQALHEGWSDYWAGSYLRSLVDDNTSIRTDWRTIFKWDSGDGQIWAGREINSTGTYPDDTRCEDLNDSNGDGCNIYQDGIIWAATMMDIHDELGRTITDQLNLQSHSYLSVPATFVDAAEALIQADLDLFDGEHTAVLLNHLGTRGYINGSAYGPVIVHDELPATEQLGGTRQIVATVSGSSASLDSVIVWYGDGGVSEQLILSNSSGSTYSGNLPLPSNSSTVSYYIEAIDMARQRSVLPSDAPQTVFSFDVGPDAQPPSIEHDPIASASIVLWPPTVAATIEDNLGIASAIVDYELRNSQGGLVESATFTLIDNDGLFQNTFPIAASAVQSGYSMNYRIVATDASSSSNVSVSPSSGFNSFEIVSDGVLAQFDFETAPLGFTASGDWQRATPEFGLEFAHSGSNAWGTNPGGQYSNLPGVSRLELPELNLSEVAEAYLVFWHWYDYEKEGVVTPLGISNAAVLWDGGNVKVSENGGASWTILQPDGGYTGVLESGTPNPLSSESSFGGYSFGWRRAVFPLPIGGSVIIRFESGSDNLNTEESHFFAGWYVDDLEITTDVGVEVQPPVISNLPAGLVPVNVADGLSSVRIGLADDTGIYRAELKVDAANSSLILDDVLLEQDPVDAGIYFGQFAQAVDPLPGDRVAFSIEVEDFDGNVTVADNDGTPFIVEFRTFLSANLLSNPVLTGLWRQDGDTYIADGTGLLVSRSALIVDPIALPENTDVIHLIIRHQYNLLTGAGGNVKVTKDAGKTWDILTPIDGYNQSLIAESHPMAGEPIFAGTVTTMTTSVFDMSAYQNDEVRLKLDLGSSRALNFSESWTVSAMTIEATTVDTDAVVELELGLTTNFPEPFSSTTNLTYSVPDVEVIKISIYDLLGRRLRVPIFGEHQPGVYTLQIAAADLAAGMYMVVLEASGSIRTEAITVIH